MIVFRLSLSKYAQDLSGRGAEKSGARWNSKGVALVYTSESRALCTAEIAIHTPLGNIPHDYELFSIEIPDDLGIHILKPSKLPDYWKSFPHAHSTQEIGDQFVLRNKFVALKVPSVVVQGEFNYLLNPNHMDFKKLSIASREAFDFDERLFK